MLRTYQINFNILCYNFLWFMAFLVSDLARYFGSSSFVLKNCLQVTAALAQAGLESSNLIVGIDFTKSNEWTGFSSYQYLQTFLFYSLSYNGPSS